MVWIFVKRLLVAVFWLALFLIVIASIGIAIIWYPFEPSRHYPQGEYISPDGRYTVKTSFIEWGDMGYSYCVDSVIVERNEDFAGSTGSSEVYSGRCFERWSGDEEYIQWLDGNSLQITIYRDRSNGNEYSFSPGYFEGEIYIKLNIQ